jgi:hypothetical protein
MRPYKPGTRNQMATPSRISERHFALNECEASNTKRLTNIGIKREKGKDVQCVVYLTVVKSKPRCPKTR